MDKNQNKHRLNAAESAVAAVSSLEELIIHIRSKEYRPNTKSIFMYKG